MHTHTVSKYSTMTQLSVVEPSRLGSFWKDRLRFRGKRHFMTATT